MQDSLIVEIIETGRLGRLKVYTGFAAESRGYNDAAEIVISLEAEAHERSAVC